MTAQSTPGTRIWTAAIVVVACLLRAGAFLVWPENLRDDRDAYLALAHQVAEGRGYSNPATGLPTAFRPPLYPLMLAGMLRMDGSAAIGIAQVVAGLATVWLTMQLGQRMKLGGGIYIAGALVAADPLLIQHTTLPMTETLCALLVALLIWSLGSNDSETTSAIRTPSRQLLVGGLFGMCVLARPTFWAFGVLAALIWMIELVAAKRNRTNRISSNPTAPGNVSQYGSQGVRRVPIWILVGVSATVAPWVIRNLLVFHRPIFTTTHGGYTLLLGNNPVFYRQEIAQPWGRIWEDAPLEESQAAWYAQLQTEQRAELRDDAGEVEVDRWMTRLAYRHIGEEPVLFLRACLHRVVRFWGFAPTDPIGRSVQPFLWWTVAMFYAFVFAGFIRGLWTVIRSPMRRAWSPLLLLIASFALVHVVYWSNMRMRAPVVPLIALISAAGWQVLWKGINPRLAPRTE